MKRYKLRVCHNDYVLKVGELDDTTCARCDPDTQTITVNKNIKADSGLQETLIHELGHALCQSMGWQQLPWWTVELEELLVENMACAFVNNLDALNAFVDDFKKLKKSK